MDEKALQEVRRLIAGFIRMRERSQCSQQKRRYTILIQRFRQAEQKLIAANKESERNFNLRKIAN